MLKFKVKVTTNLTNILTPKSTRENETYQESCLQRPRTNNTQKIKHILEKNSYLAKYKKISKHKFILLSYKTVLKHGFQVDTNKRPFLINVHVI